MELPPGRVYWFTGLSGVGKTTLCQLFVDALRRRGHSIVRLDGDELRQMLGQQAGHSRKERLTLALKYSQLCRMIARNGVDVAIATISLFREVHAWNRRHLPVYCEILLTAPMSELSRRDSKGIYSLAAKGCLRDVAGIDLEVDMPGSPDVTLPFDPSLGPEATLQMLLQALGMEQAE